MKGVYWEEEGQFRERYKEKEAKLDTESFQTAMRSEGWPRKTVAKGCLSNGHSFEVCVEE